MIMVPLQPASRSVGFILTVFFLLAQHTFHGSSWWTTSFNSSYGNTTNTVGFTVSQYQHS